MVGKYGLGCIYNCSRYCWNGDFCNIIIGVCDIGCKDGYMGEMCDKGYFLMYFININVRY